MRVAYLTADRSQSFIRQISSVNLQLVKNGVLGRFLWIAAAKATPCRSAPDRPKPQSLPWPAPMRIR